MIKNSELQLFDNIKDKCKVVFDIGCRSDDTYSGENSDTKFFLFEPNTQFYSEVSAKTVHKDNVRVFNFGLSDETKDSMYYQNTQSVMDRTHHTASDYTNAIVVKLVRFSDFIKDHKIEHIDFIKIDTEGCELNILTDGEDFIKKNVDYLQIEYASTWLDNKKFGHITLKDFYTQFCDTFKFYFLYDEMHPISKEYSNTMTQIDTYEIIEKMHNWMTNACGFDLVLIRR